MRTSIEKTGTEATMILLAATLPIAAGLAQTPGEIKLKATLGVEGDEFGNSVAISDDFVLVGAHLGDPFAGSGDFGFACVYDPITGQQLRRLEVSTGMGYLFFGKSVSLSGPIALIGASYDDGVVPHTGAAYLFDAGTGTQLHKLVASDGELGDAFGYSVSFSGDLALIGAWGDDDNGTQAGAAYVFDATTGQPLHRLTPLDGAQDDRFGRCVALAGNLAVIGAPMDSDNGAWSGSVYVFDATTGQQLTKLTANDGAASDGFGSAVSIYGGTVLVGSPGDDDFGDRSGSAYLFDALTGQQLGKIHAGNEEVGARFGSAVALHAGGALISAPEEDTNGPDSGAVYCFNVSTGELLYTLVPLDAEPGDGYACSVAIHGSRGVVGAYLDSYTASPGQGSAYLFDGFEIKSGIAYCFGDPGSGTQCPCGNDNDGSVHGSGCDNGFFSTGARLSGSGTPSVLADNLVLTTTGLEPNNTGLYFQASSRIADGNGLHFGDGLRCAGGALVRLQIRFANASGVSSTTIPISVKGGVSAGDTLRYQCWYRTTTASPCSSEFNLSNGYEVTWIP